MLRQFFTDLAEVFDNAVVYDSNPTTLMRVGVVGVGCTVGRPARMTDARSPCERFMHQQIVQVRELAHRATSAQLPITNRRNTCTVIPAVLELFQTLYKDRSCLMGSQNAYNSTHIKYLSNVTTRRALPLRPLTF